MRYMIIVKATRDSQPGVLPPNPAVDGGEAQIEVRQRFALDDFGPCDAVERFREIGIGGMEDTR